MTARPDTLTTAALTIEDASVTLGAMVRHSMFGAIPPAAAREMLTLSRTLAEVGDIVASVARDRSAPRWSRGRFDWRSVATLKAWRRAEAAR